MREGEGREIGGEGEGGEREIGRQRGEGEGGKMRVCIDFVGICIAR